MVTEEDAGKAWVPIDLSTLDPLDGTGVPFDLVVNRFKSSSQDCEDFIHDPLTVMQSAPELERFGLNEGEWKVTTLVVNHHRTLSATHLHVLAAIDNEEKTVALTLVKKPPNP